MPAPASIICCESILRDMATGLVSYINIIEYIAVVRTTATPDQPPPAMPVLSFHLASKWMREESDAPDTVFEVHNVLKKANAPNFAVARADIKLENPFHIVISRLQLASIPGPGIIYAESSIRRRGEQEWLCHQRYPIIAREEAPTAEPNAPSPGQASATQQAPSGSPSS